MINRRWKWFIVHKYISSAHSYILYMNGTVSTDIPSVSQTHRPDLEESSLPCSSCMDLTGAAATSQTNRETNQTQTDKKKSSVHTTVKMQGFYDVKTKWDLSRHSGNGCNVNLKLWHYRECLWDINKKTRMSHKLLKEYRYHLVYFVKVFTKC